MPCGGYWGANCITEVPFRASRVPTVLFRRFLLAIGATIALRMRLLLPIGAQIVFLRRLFGAAGATIIFFKFINLAAKTFSEIAQIMV